MKLCQKAYIFTPPVMQYFYSIVCTVSLIFTNNISNSLMFLRLFWFLFSASLSASVDGLDECYFSLWSVSVFSVDFYRFRYCYCFKICANLPMLSLLSFSVFLLKLYFCSLTGNLHAFINRFWYVFCPQKFEQLLSTWLTQIASSSKQSDSSESPFCYNAIKWLLCFD